MSKPLLGLILGVVLGFLDGLTALFTPAVAGQMTEILIGSSVKGMLAGLIIGFFARKVRSLTTVVLFGGVVGLLLATLVAAMPDPSGNHYWIEIMVPGTIVGLILGFATQKYGTAAKPLTAR
jgi:hypothetical protein